jgi:5-methylcytosine-specific restriction protein A
MVNWNILRDNLSGRFGLELSVSDIGEKKALLRVEGIDPPNGFGIEISIGWRSVEARFKPDTFASALIKTIKRSSSQQHLEFSALAGSFKRFGMNLHLKANGSIIDAEALPAEGGLDKFELQCAHLSDRSDDQLTATETGSACLALILTLLPIESDNDGFEAGAEEGSMSRVEVNRYERSPSNRAAAITFHGSRCHVCDFDFETTYGLLGKGFIEIHHKIPVSRMGANYIVNPAEDLVPLCSNCHRMIHRHDSPLEIETLKKLISQD